MENVYVQIWNKLIIIILNTFMFYVNITLFTTVVCFEFSAREQFAGSQNIDDSQI
jgi:hypothetical protein